jgi:AcrR family transcriptional regulator
LPNVQNPRPRQRNKDQQKRQHILDAASHLFLSEGFKSVSMVDVAERAAVSKQTVYSHFNNKDQLFSAAIEAKCQEFEILDTLEDLQRPIKATLVLVACQFDALICSFEGLRIFGICAANALSSKADKHISQLFWQAGPEKVKQAIVNYLQAQIQAEQIKLEQVNFAAQQFLFMLQAEKHMRLVIGLEHCHEDGDTLAYINSCVDVFCRAYDIKG